MDTFDCEFPVALLHNMLMAITNVIPFALCRGYGDDTAQIWKPTVEASPKLPSLDLMPATSANLFPWVGKLTVRFPDCM
jgi:hypothetical protein